MGRLQKDASSSVTVSVALPNAANTVVTNAIDLGAGTGFPSNVAATPFPTTDFLEVSVSSTVATGANSKNINTVLQHSDDTNTSNFVNIPQLAPWVNAGNTTNFPAASTAFKLPSNVKRYIRASATGEANGGNSSDGTLTVQLLF